MKIANFKEYIAVLREVYSQDAMDELGSYYHALMSSGAELKKQKAQLQKQLYRLNAEIKQAAEDIRLSTDKKAAGLKMAELRRRRQEQVKLLKEQQNGDHFNVLSDEAKICVCSGFLLQKYLARELLENNPLRFHQDNRGDLIVDAARLRASEIMQEAGHIRDFVGVYLNRYPDRVKTPGHFKTLLNGINNWGGLVEYADNFFEHLNDGDIMEDGPVKASRCGAEVVKRFPEQNLQLVRLHNAKALDYESAKMEHCVGKGGYDKKIKSGKTQIYSLRDDTAEGEWLPHATIEYIDGEIKQIKGFKNQIIPPEYIPVMREAVRWLSAKAGKAKQRQISDLKNIGFWVDTQGKIIDITNLKEEVFFSTLHQNEMPLFKDKEHLVSIEDFLLGNKLDCKTLKNAKKFKHINHLRKDSNCLLLDDEFVMALDIDIPDNGKSTPADFRLNLAARRYISELFGKEPIERLLPRIDPAFWKDLGYIEAVSGPCYKNLVDIISLKEDIEIKELRQDELQLFKDKEHLVSVEKFLITKEMDKETLDSVKKFKKIEQLGKDRYTPAASNNYQTARSYISEILGNRPIDELLPRIDSEIYRELGFMSSVDPERVTGLIAFSDLQTSSASRCNKFFDITRLKENITVAYLGNELSYWADADLKHLICEEVKISGKIEKGTDTALASLAGAYNLIFDEPDFAAVDKFDLSGLQRMYESPSRNINIFNRRGIFLEDNTIPILFAGAVVSFQKCRNLPAPDKIKLPPQVKHLMLDFCKDNAEKNKADLPNLSGYKNLESLQLNNIDFSSAQALRLPKGLKYLAFYNCRFADGTDMDFNRFDSLQQLRLRKCELQGVEHFAFPPSLREIEVSGARFKDGAILDLSSCREMKEFSLQSWNTETLSIGALKLPAGIEKIRLSEIKFPLLKEFNLENCTALQELDMEKAACPKLKKLLIPSRCDKKLKGLVLAAGLSPQLDRGRD